MTGGQDPAELLQAGFHILRVHEGDEGSPEDLAGGEAEVLLPGGGYEGEGPLGIEGEDDVDGLLDIGPE